jgi:fibronectin type 3 domain-containing protein
MRKKFAKKLLCVALAVSLMLGETVSAFAATASTDVGASGESAVEVTVQDEDTEQAVPVPDEESEEISEDADVADEVSADEEDADVTDVAEQTEVADSTESVDITEEPLIEEDAENADSDTDNENVLAEESKEDSQAELAGAEDSAQLADESAYVTYLNVYNTSSSDTSVSVYYGGYGEGTVNVYINNVLVSTKYETNEYYWSESYEFYEAVAGGTYTVKLESPSTGATQSQTFTKGDISVSSVSATTNTKTDKSYGGYRQADGVNVSAYISSTIRGKYNYEIWRSTKAGSGFKKIDSVSGEGELWEITYTDRTVKSGTSYYYQVRFYTGTDNYIKKNTLVAKGTSAKVTYAKPEATVYTSAGYIYNKKGVNTGKLAVTVSVSSDLGNQFDVYKSKKPNSGFKKIKTIYSNTYEDTNVKKGVTYYYKVVPKYYDSKTKKISKGAMSEASGVKFVMTQFAPSLEQVSKTSMNVSWGELKNSGATSVEVWYKRSDLAGDAYKKAVSTTASNYTLKNLASSGEYSVMLKTVKKSGKVVKYEFTNSNTLNMGYTDLVSDFYGSSTKSTISSNKKTITIYYTCYWNKDWGASGYIIKGYNSSTNKWVTLKKVKSFKKTSCTVKIPVIKNKGAKYTSLSITPYKGSKIGESRELSYPEIVLPAPKTIKVSKKSASSVKVTWSKVGGASTYMVYRYSDMGVNELVGTTKSTSFVDKTVTTSTKYNYYVYACADSSFKLGEASYSTAWTDTYEHTASAPKIKSVTNSAKKTAVIKWSKIAGATSYIVYRSTSKNGKYTKVGTVSASKQVYTDKKVTKGKTYYYKVVVKVKNTGGEVSQSKYSAEKSVKIKK